MSRPNRPDDDGARLAAIERRLKALEVGGRAEHTAIQGGSFRVRDVAGDERVKIGDLDDDNNRWGIRIIDGGVIQITEGGVFLIADIDGLERVQLGDLGDGLYGLRINEDAVIQIVQGGVMSIGDDEDDVRIRLGDPTNTGDYNIDILEGGLLRVTDPADVVRARIGDLGSDNFGVEIFDATGGRRFAAHSDGLKDPYQSWQVAQAQSRVSVDDTMVGGIGTHTSIVHLVSHLGVIVRVSALIDPGVTGEVWLLNNDTLTETDRYPISGGFGDVTFKWLHGSPLGTEVVPFEVKAQITSGVGVMEVFDPPGGLIMADPAVCTATGLP